MSKVKRKSTGTHNHSEKASSWNACEHKLLDCINRNQFIKDIRRKVAKKKYKRF